MLFEIAPAEVAADHHSIWRYHKVKLGRVKHNSAKQKTPMRPQKSTNKHKNCAIGQRRTGRIVERRKSDEANEA